MFVVYRIPTLQEDEGRVFLLSTYETRELAEEAIRTEVERVGGYFRESDYRIATTE